ncbi:uncharacterized protein TRUGW13939_08220 [Talaromyces rugulosus]|uniref:Uncharacterized protein n=1 Tax=Talaromyces rugulosus TaxID=121627 RepID=A0A7H8R3Z3_TALRU|nr:uncharacterized protein TRUGW13939_08220 [Talaromyces rugulosus]QKX61074.1 hypothetical protein TRUGW13939_08220 [Talaromyces rugulosus]
MALAVKPPQDRKRVKVYELRDNDWYDRGTGFCTGAVVEDVPRIYVESEDEKGRCLLDTSIGKDEGYQKQQETLIVWTETNGTDMALSFQEADGCAAIWEYVSSVQHQLLALAGDDALSDDAIEAYQHPIMLPPPELGNLPEIEQAVRSASLTQVGRDALGKFVLGDNYIDKLIPLVETAEDLESLPDLHRLCNIMKSLILLNDNIIIEHVVTDPIIIGVVGALEYDPDFPTHKANHRQYLQDQSRYKEVVPMKDPVIQKKIRQTWRLQYLKDVVLARILDDPTFSVLNSLIFFNQVDIINHIQTNAPFLNDLFRIFAQNNANFQRKDDAVCFIHQCASIAKNLQAPARATLFANLINHGLFAVIAFAVKHPKPAMRTTGIDILVALLDHDPIMMRSYMLKAVTEKKTPLTDTLIDLLHTEDDLGVKNQLSDAIKVLLDPQIPLQETVGRMGGDFTAKIRSTNQLPDAFVQNHFDESARRLFTPLKALENRASLNDFTFQDVSLYAHLVDILTFFVRQHLFRSRSVIHTESLAPRVAQLLKVPQKHLKLTALKFFRTLVSLQDTFYLAQLTHNNIFGLILDIVYETMPRDNLLNSACLELFEYIKRENIKPIITHVVEKCRDKLKAVTYVDTFENLIQRYDQLQGYEMEGDATLYSQQEAALPQRGPVNGQWQGVRGLDAAEEEYFNTSDDEEEWPPEAQQDELATQNQPPANIKLVDYPDDDEDEVMDAKSEVAIEKQEIELPERGLETDTPSTPTSTQPQIPPERLSEKRRRNDEDDDELVRLSQNGPKRRSSNASSTGSSYLRRRRNSVEQSITNKKAAGGDISKTAPKKIAINLSPSLKSSVTVEAEAIQISDIENPGNDEPKDDTQNEKSA